MQHYIDRTERYERQSEIAESIKYLANRISLFSETRSLGEISDIEDDDIETELHLHAIRTSCRELRKVESHLAKILNDIELDMS